MHYHGREALRFVGLSRDEASDGYLKIEVEQAECFKAEDKEMILGEIVKKHGSYKDFNQKLSAKWELLGMGLI